MLSEHCVNPDMDEISSILVAIKQTYCNLKAKHRKHYSCNLKNVEQFKLLESKQTDIGIGNQVLVAYNKFFDATLKSVLPNKGVVLHGEAGVGKTMLCLSILEDWATGKLFQEFHVILYLPLRNIAAACSLPEVLSILYPDFNPETCAKFVTYLEQNEIHNILIIGDGWEDLQSSQCHTESFIHSLLFSSDIMPNLSVSVLITTCTSKLSCIQTCTLDMISRFVTLNGFDKMDIESIIQSEFEGDFRAICHLTAQLNDNLLIASICDTPFHLAILCDLCRSSGNAKPLPNTVTQLYAELIWTLASINIRRKDTYKNILTVSKYDDLPDGLRRPWQFLCEVAFKNFEKGHNIFSHSLTNDLKLSELKMISYFGLIKPISEGGDTLSLSFLDPCFEEYLGSFYLAIQPQETLLTLIQDISRITKSGSNAIIPFWHFFVSNYVHMVANVNTDIILQVLKNISIASGSNRGSYFVSLCHISFEAKNSVVNDEVIKALCAEDKKTLNFGHCYGIHDCDAMIYVIENITQECKVEINFQECCLNSTHIDNLANALGSRSSILQVRGLNLSGNRLDNSLAVVFFNKATAAFKYLTILILSNCDIGTDFDIQTILSALLESSCQTLSHLDLSFNPLSVSFLQVFEYHIQSHTTFDSLQILSLKGSFKTDISTSLSNFADTLSSRCKYLRRLDLSDNSLGEPGNPDLRKMISQLLSLGNDFDLCLNEEYMAEVSDQFVYVMEECIKRKGIINHTIAHGVIVGPGRSGKNSLMDRLMGNGPPDPGSISPSTGVLENVVKIEVKKLCTVATAVSNLEWMKLKHDEEALELIMTTARHYSPTRIAKPNTFKYILKAPEESVLEYTKVVQPPLKVVPCPKQRRIKYNVAKLFNFRKLRIKSDDVKKNQDKTEVVEKSNVIIYKPDVGPADIFKRAIKLQGMDGLREHLESSWSLYLTNTGGQIEFQEYLPLLVCGPSIFFLTFPLHYDLEKPYNVRYEYPDGKVEEYKSPGTLLEELLQTLATINASNFTSGQQRSSGADIKPKIFFIGTHRDCLLADTAEESIESKDKLLQCHVRQTSLFRQGSIQFAKGPERLIFTVNNLSNDDEEFQTIRSSVQQTVERNSDDFTVECPSSWLVLSLILRAKYESDQVLTFEKCYNIAQGCGITNRSELKQALSFIHSRLGLIRYFNTDDLNTLVVIDPQILFDRITDLIVATFTSNNVEANEIEEFRRKGIIPLAVMEKLSDKKHSNSQLPFKWLTSLLNYLRMAALFIDHDGKKYFFPTALCHASEPQCNPSLRSFSPLLLGFENGFCPRGIPGALIKYLMTNEMNSRTKWEIIPDKIFRNQVSFAIQAHEIVTLKIMPTHLEISCETEEVSYGSDEDDTTENELIRRTCEIAYTQIRKGMIAVTDQCNECKFFFGFHCNICETHHPAQIQWDDKYPFKLLCKITNKRGNLPRDSKIWNLQRNPNKGTKITIAKFN